MREQQQPQPQDAIHPTQSTSEQCRTLVDDGAEHDREGSSSDEEHRRARDDEDRRLAQSFSLQHLVQARASLSLVVKMVTESTLHEGTDGAAGTATMLPRLARVVDAEWKLAQPSRDAHGEASGGDAEEDCGAASRRYLRRLVEAVVNHCEANLAKDASSGEHCHYHGDGLDELYEVWATMVACPLKTTVSERASSIVTFHVPKDLVSNAQGASQTSSFAVHMADSNQDDHLTLRFRTYPYHNDVSLRLWEAGVVLAELLVSNRSLSSLVRARRVVELGSGGVGLTGAVALCGCRAAHYTCTDFSTLAILNLRHNMMLNRRALGVANKWEGLCYDWNDAVHCNAAQKAAAAQLASSSSDAPRRSTGRLVGPSTCSPMAHISNASVLVAADVAYDDEAIPGLVETFRLFFASGMAAAATESSPGGGGKVAILAVRRRRQSTFDALMRTLRSRLLLLDNSDSDSDSATKGDGDSGRVMMSVSVELEQVLGPRGAGSKLWSGSPLPAPPPPPPPPRVLFPTHFVQPRSDVAVFLLRGRGARSSARSK
jgi:predicted nicotinamide N-methyase